MRASRQAVTANYRTTRDMTRPQIIRKHIMLDLIAKIVISRSQRDLSDERFYIRLLKGGGRWGHMH